MSTTPDRPDEKSGEALLIVRAALDRPASERSSFIAERCADDEGLRRVVDRLLLRVDEVELEDAWASMSSSSVGADPMIGMLLGRFRIVERVGRGGMGVVYRAEREGSDFQQTVAIKLIRRGFDFDEVQARFLRERRILSRLSHPNLARFIDGGMAPDGRPWFALEYVRGESIRSWCDSRRLDVRSRVRLFLHVCAAVQYAHSQLVVHRDLKPGNILVDDDGTVHLLDFGISRLLEGDSGEATLTLAGLRFAMTPEYAAPEQFGGEAGIAADLYSLGVILYELVSGVLPHDVDRRDLMEAERCVRTLPPQPLAQAISRNGHEGVSSAEPLEQRLECRSMSLRAYQATVRGDLSRILGTVLAKEPEHRYASVETFAEDLRRWLVGAPVRVSGRRMGYRLGKFVKRNRIAIGVVLLFAVALGASLVQGELEARRRLTEVTTERTQTRASLDFLGGLFADAAPSGLRGPNATARDLLLSGIERLKKDATLPPKARSELFLIVGESLNSLGLVDDARIAYDLAAAEQRKYRATSEETARLRVRLAINKHDKGDLAGARNEAAALVVDMERQGRVDRYVIDARSLQANISLQFGEYEKALTEMAPALSLLDHPAIAMQSELVADTRYLYGSILIGLERRSEAETELRKSIALYQKVEPGHPSIGKTLATIALIHLDEGNFAESDKVFASAIESLLQVLGPENRDLSMTRGNYGSLLLAMGSPDRAVTQLRESIRIEAALDIDNPISESRQRSKLGRALLESGHPEEARVELETALHLARRGEDQITVGIVGFTLAYLDCLEGRNSGRSALEAAQPDEDIYVTTRIRARYYLAHCIETLGDRKSANERYSQLVSLAREAGIHDATFNAIQEGFRRTR